MVGSRSLSCLSRAAAPVPLLSFPSVENNIPGRAQENMHHFDFGLPDLCPLCGLSEHRRGEPGSCSALACCVALARDEKKSAPACSPLGPLRRGHLDMNQLHCHCWGQDLSPLGGPLTTCPHPTWLTQQSLQTASLLLFSS